MPKRKPVSNKYARKSRRKSSKAQSAPVTGKTFPATEQTPGQTESRAAFKAFQDKRSECPWWIDFLRLMAEHDLDWRKAAYVAWASSPAAARWPPTIKELAAQILGCSDRVVRKWREDEPALDLLVAQEQAAPLLRHRRDIYEALVTVATTPAPDAHPDRKLALQMMGDFKPSGSVEVTGEGGGPVGVLDWSDLLQMEEHELDTVIVNLEAIQASLRSGAAGEETAPGRRPAA